MDRQLREHLRAWESTGDAGAQRRYLAARLRSGEVSRDALRCAAWVGDPVSRELLGEELRPPARGTLAWIAGLPCPDHEVGLRAGLAILDAWTAASRAWSTVEQQVVDAVRAWLDCPCPRHLDALHVAEQPLRDGDPFGLRRWVAAAVPGGACSRPHAVICPGIILTQRGDPAVLRALLAPLLVPWVLTRQVPPAWLGCYEA